jgi:hypothetical protein
MKQSAIILTCLLLVTCISCSKDHDDPPPPANMELLVKEKESFFAPGWQQKSSLQRFSYDGAGQLVKVRYDVRMHNDAIQPGTYDSLVYQSNKLFERFRFQYENTSQRFYLDNKQTYQYSDGLPVTILLSLYDHVSKTYTLSSKTIVRYDNGKEVEQKVYDKQNNLIGGYSKIYQGTRVTELVGFNGLNDPIYKNVYQYSNDTLIGMKEFDGGQGSFFERINVVYMYKKGKLVKESYTTMPPYSHIMDSTVYRY